jgi:NAD(P)-dependent dehydrogenase (short-subunit alcohol dehydrogenase family)/SAM-dependent methyltransferase
MSAKMHALITGGSSGIGKALGGKLAAAGYHISLIARRDHLLADAAAEMRCKGKRTDQRVAFYPADVADRPQAEAAVKSAIAEFGPPDIVVASAGIAEPGYFAEMSADIFERAIAINYLGTLYVLRTVLPSMRARRRGRIVLISSGAALLGVFGYASYGPSKFAVRGLAETLRAELRSDDIGVSVAYPPETETPMLEKANKTMPPETRLICSLAKAWTADAVADCILRGIERGTFAITPGLTLTLMHRFPGVAIPVLRWYCDRLADGVHISSSQSTQLPVTNRGNPPMKFLSSAKHGFMSFWYFYVSILNSIWPSITLEGKRLVIFPNVYKPLENEHVCSEYCREGDRVLDLGCGSGVGTVFCAAKAREVIAVDISLPAVRNTEENCRLHGLKNVKVIQSDMFSRVEGKYDLILANSPYIEDEFGPEERQFATSVKYLPTLFAQVGDYLTEDGRLLVQFPSWSRPRIEKLAAKHGLELISMKPLPPKPPTLSLLSVLYMQIGFKSALYLLQRQSTPSLALAANG